MPNPKNNQDDLFPCCRTCQLLDRQPSSNEPIWRKTANAAWLRAEWKWDFGHLLPAGLISYGLGVTPPVPQPKRDRLFLLKPDLTRGYLDLDLQVHAQLKNGDQHEAKARVSVFLGSESVVFEGQLLVSTTGDIRFAVPRSQWFGDGKEIWKRFIFESPVMPYDLPNLVLDGDNIKKVNNKIEFMGVEL